MNGRACQKIRISTYLNIGKNYSYLLTKEMEILKNEITPYNHQTGWNKETVNTVCWWRSREKKPFMFSWCKYDLVHPLWKTFGNIGKGDISYSSETSFFSQKKYEWIPKNTKNCHRNITPIFLTAATFSSSICIYLYHLSPHIYYHDYFSELFWCKLKVFFYIQIVPNLATLQEDSCILINK